MEQSAHDRQHARDDPTDAASRRGRLRCGRKPARVRPRIPTGLRVSLLVAGLGRMPLWIPRLLRVPRLPGKTLAIRPLRIRHASPSLTMICTQSNDLDASVRTPLPSADFAAQGLFG